MDSIIDEFRKEIEKGKICIVCEEKPALFCIRGSPKDCYCTECANENFGSIDYLERL